MKSSYTFVRRAWQASWVSEKTLTSHSTHVGDGKLTVKKWRVDDIQTKNWKYVDKTASIQQKYPQPYATKVRSIQMCR